MAEQTSSFMFVDSVNFLATFLLGSVAPVRFFLPRVSGIITKIILFVKAKHCFTSGHQGLKSL